MKKLNRFEINLKELKKLEEDERNKEWDVYECNITYSLDDIAKIDDRYGHGFAIFLEDENVFMYIRKFSGIIIYKADYLIEKNNITFNKLYVNKNGFKDEYYLREYEIYKFDNLLMTYTETFESKRKLHEFVLHNTTYEEIKRKNID